MSDEILNNFDLFYGILAQGEKTIISFTCNSSLVLGPDLTYPGPQANQQFSDFWGPLKTIFPIIQGPQTIGALGCSLVSVQVNPALLSTMHNLFTQNKGGQPKSLSPKSLLGRIWETSKNINFLCQLLTKNCEKILKISKYYRVSIQDWAAEIPFWAVHGKNGFN